MPAGAPVMQRECMRRAFYLGAGHVFAQVSEHAGAMEFDGDGAVEEFEAYLEGLAAELAAFVTDMRVAESVE